MTSSCGPRLSHPIIKRLVALPSIAPMPPSNIVMEVHDSNLMEHIKENRKDKK